MADPQETAQTAQQTVQEAAQNAAKQIAQVIEQFTQKLGVQTATTQRDSTVTARDIAEETGMGEAFQTGMISQTRSWDANVKHLFDGMLNASMESIRHAQTHFDRMMTNAISGDNDLRKHYIENANFASKGYFATVKLGDDRMWNIDEVAKYVTESAEFTQAVAAAFAKVVADMAKEKPSA